MSDQPMQFGLIWPEVEDVPVLRVNQWVGQFSSGPDGLPEEMILIAGMVTPPLILGPPEEQHALMQSLSAVPVKTVARLSLSKARLEELAAFLNGQVAAWNSIEGDQA